MYSGLTKVYILFPLISTFSTLFPFVSTLGLALRMKTHCSSGEKQLKIIGMHKVCAKGVEITTKLGHLKTIVYIVIKRFESFRIVEGKKSTGHPQKLSNCSRRVVTYALVVNQRQTLVNITNQYGFDVNH